MRQLEESEKVLDMSKNKPAAKKIRWWRQPSKTDVYPYGSC